MLDILEKDLKAKAEVEAFGEEQGWEAITADLTVKAW